MVRHGIARRIRSRRKELKLSQRQLARLVGVTPYLISEYERGRRSPSLDTLKNLTLALRVSAEWLIHGHERS